MPRDRISTSTVPGINHLTSLEVDLPQRRKVYRYLKCWTESESSPEILITAGKPFTSKEDFLFSYNSINWFSSRPSSIKYNCFYSRFWSMPSIFCCKCNYWFIDSVHPYQGQGWNARLNWYCWPIKAIISLRGLGNESLIEETGFVSQVNEFEIDSSEKLERHGVTRLKGEVNELPAKLFTLMSISCQPFLCADRGFCRFLSLFPFW